MDNSLPKYEAFRAKLKEQEIRERAQGNIESAQEIVASLRVFRDMEEEFKLWYGSQEKKVKEKEIARPGVKPAIMPKVNVPILFENDKPERKLFLQNIFHKKITKEKLTKLFEEFALTGVKVKKINFHRGTTTVTCKRLEIV